MGQTRSSDHFEIEYELRHTPDGECFGQGGVRHHNLVSCYLQALELLHSTLSTPPFSLPPPGKTRVLLRDTLTPETRLQGDLIVLPSRFDEPDVQVVRRRAAVSAVHEATHVFCLRLRPPRWDRLFGLWFWVHEATAVFMEGYLYPDSPESNRFALEWVDQPHCSLDQAAKSPFHVEAPYHSGWFLRYLAKRAGPGIIGRLWKDAFGPGYADPEGPWDALHRLQGEACGTPILDGTRRFSPFFAEYCFDSYHLNDHNLAGFLPDVYVRYRGRALRKWVRLAPGEECSYNITKENGDTIPRLACHYYRVDPGTMAKTLDVTLGYAAHTPLALSVAVVDRHRHRSHHQFLLPNSVWPPVRISLALPPPDSIHHAVICVANPALAGGGAEYQLAIQAR